MKPVVSEFYLQETNPHRSNTWAPLGKPKTTAPCVSALPPECFQCSAIPAFPVLLGMSPFFSFFGSKWRVARHYSTPTHPTIIEPFAGSAGYSLRYPEHQVRLYDADPIICGVWHYLIHVRPEKIRRLPLVFGHVDELDLCQEAKWLIGFWLNKGCVGPSKSPSQWMRDYQARQPGCTYWSAAVVERIATQVGSIRHWTINKSRDN